MSKLWEAYMRKVSSVPVPTHVLSVHDEYIASSGDTYNTACEVLYDEAHYLHTRAPALFPQPAEGEHPLADIREHIRQAVPHPWEVTGYGYVFGVRRVKR